MEKIKLTNRDNKKAASIRNTIILVKPLPRLDGFRNRWYLNGKEMNTEAILRLLRKAGHTIEEKQKATTFMAKEYKGIGISTANSGYMVCAKNQEEHQKLMGLLLDDGYFYHSCYLMPDKRRWKK